MRKISKETIDNIIDREKRHYKNNNKPIYKAEYMSWDSNQEGVAIISINEKDYFFEYTNNMYQLMEGIK